MLKYYTKAWQAEVADRLKTDSKFAQDGRRLNGTFVFRCYDCPDGKDRQVIWTFKGGQVVKWTYEAKKAPWSELRDAPFDSKWVMRATATYDMSADLNKGNISPLRALTSPNYQIEGSKLMIMQLMKALNVWNAVAASVECTYEYSKE
jgi:hypothetical protein